MSEVERSYSVSAHWDGDVETSTIKVTDTETGQEWQLAWYEVFLSEIPAADRDVTVYVRYQVDPGEQAAKRYAIETVRHILGPAFLFEDGAAAIGPSDLWKLPVLGVKVARGTKTLDEMREMV